MELIKNIQTQDSGLKSKPVHSGESAINISNEILDLIYNGGYEREVNVDITFTLYKEDFLQAFSFIINKLPLYKTSSQDAVQQNFSVEFCNKYSSRIEEFFGSEKTKTYTCNLLLRKDGRNYLNKLKVGNFSVRDFLIDGYAQLIFGKSETGGLYLRVKYSDQLPAGSRLLISEKKHCTFVLKCMTFFKNSPLWSRIEQFTEPFSLGDSIKVSGTDFKLTGFFKYVPETTLTELNTPRRRWYLEPFLIQGKSVYLSTEWYPKDNSTIDRSYQLTLPEFGRFISTCFGQEYKVVRNDDVWELWQSESAEVQERRTVSSNNRKEKSSFVPVESESFSISKLIEYISETKLIYDSKLVKRFAFSLLSKRFLILSGLAGSGKTQLALAFSKAMIEKDSQMCVVSVGADWTNREPLLGFPNALQEGSYVKPESKVLDLLIEANKEENKDKPFFLILDEMNMSYVERYFADFLSVMESHEAIALWNGSEASDVPASIKLPDNLFIIGTINVDETTYMFSPKVLDRANVIEFKIGETDMKKFLDKMKPVAGTDIKYRAAGMGTDFVRLANTNELAGEDEVIKTTLIQFFKNLKLVNAEFGYRSATEIYRFIRQAQSNDDSVHDKLTDDEILDCAIVQKLLPKLHGSRKKLEPVLLALWKECFESTEQKETTSISMENVVKAKYRLTADKLQRMYEAAYANGFTSFAEA